MRIPVRTRKSRRNRCCSGRSRCGLSKGSCCRSGNNRRQTYHALDNQLVDRRSKQLLFNDFDINMMDRTRLKRNEMFSESTANALIQKHMRKKKSTGKVNFLVDRMRFERGCCNCCCGREYLNYREIKHTYTFPSRPSAFMLGVQEEKTGKRYYETYVCKNATDFARVQQLLERTSADPEHILRTCSVSNVNSAVYPPVDDPFPAMPQANVVPNEMQKTSVMEKPRPVTQCTSPIGLPTPPVTTKNTKNTFEVPMKTEVVHSKTAPDYWAVEDYTGRITPPIILPYQESQQRSQMNPPIKEHTIPVHSYSPVYETYQTPVRSEPIPKSYITEQPTDFYPSNRVVSVPGTTKLRNRSASFDRNEIVSMMPDEVTFLDPNTMNGPEVVERGSVYLYLSREKFDDPTL